MKDSRPDKNSHLRTGNEKETEGVTLVSSCHRIPQFLLRPSILFAGHAGRVSASHPAQKQEKGLAAGRRLGPSPAGQTQDGYRVLRTTCDRLP